MHAADLHLDSPFTGLKTAAPENVASTLHSATFDAYENIINLCISEQVDALLIAGDIYDGADRSLRAQMKFVEGLQWLSAQGIRSFVCHGNHDPLDGWEARLTLPHGCHRFGATFEAVPMFEDDPGRAVVHGVSYPKRDVKANLVRRLEKVEPGPVSIGLLHANVGGDPNHGAYAPCSLDDLAQTGIDYWALGHVHTRKVLSEQAPTVVYPGNPQGRHANRNRPQGCLPRRNRRFPVRSSSTSAPSMLSAGRGFRWTSPPLETEQKLLDSLDRCLEEASERAERRSVVVRVTLSGRGPLYHSLRRPDLIEELLEEVNGQWVDQSPFVWCERIENETASPFNRGERLQGSDFVADLLRLCDQAQTDADMRKRLQDSLPDLFDHRTYKRHLRDVTPSDEVMATLIAEAEAIAIDLLIGEDDVMRIVDFHIDGFGHFADADVGPFGSPVTVFFGLNEAGKSTYLQFIRAILFGFPRRRGGDFYPPQRGGSHGGRITLAAKDGAKYIVQRTQGPGVGPVTLRSSAGETLNEAMLAGLLGHHGKDVFEKVFAFTLDELHSEDSLKDESVNSQIYSAGMGATNLPAVLKQLKSNKDSLFRKGGSKQKIAEVNGRLSEVDSKLREVANNAARYGELTTSLGQVAADLQGATGPSSRIPLTA